ncbi:hypothetical protein GCM10009780_77010 [Actinomadura alba]
MPSPSPFTSGKNCIIRSGSSIAVSWSGMAIWAADELRAMLPSEPVDVSATGAARCVRLRLPLSDRMRVYAHAIHEADLAAAEGALVGHPPGADTMQVCE